MKEEYNIWDFIGEAIGLFLIIIIGYEIVLFIIGFFL